jgi:CRISPR-associated protein Cas2
VVLLDLGLAERVVPRVVSLGKTFTPIEREPVIV